MSRGSVASPRQSALIAARTPSNDSSLLKKYKSQWKGKTCEEKHRRPAEVPFDGGRPWEPWRFECRRAAENVALKEQWAVFYFLFSGFRLSTRHSKERENVKVMFLETDVVGCLRLSTLSLVIICSVRMEERRYYQYVFVLSCMYDVRRFTVK